MRPGSRSAFLAARAPRSLPAPGLVLVAIASVQAGSGLARGLFDTAGAAGVVLLRLGLSALVLLAVVRPDPRRMAPAARWAALRYGLVMGAMNLSFYEAIARIPLGVAVTVEFLGPLTVALIGARRWLHALWVSLAAAGVVLLAAPTGGAGVPLLGLALALVAGICWGGYIYASRQVGRLLTGTTGLALALPVGAALVAPFGAADVARGVAADPAVLAGGAAVALLSSVVPYSLELAALRRMSTTVFGVLMSLEPAAAALAGFALLGQRLTGVQGIALGLVSVASAGVTLSDRKGLPPQPLE